METLRLRALTLGMALLTWVLSSTYVKGDFVTNGGSDLDVDLQGNGVVTGGDGFSAAGMLFLQGGVDTPADGAPIELGQMLTTMAGESYDAAGGVVDSNDPGGDDLGGSAVRVSAASFTVAPTSANISSVPLPGTAVSALVLMGVLGVYRTTRRLRN